MEKITILGEEYHWFAFQIPKMVKAFTSLGVM